VLHHAPETYRRGFAGRVPEKIEGFYGMIENIDDNVGRPREAPAQWG